MPEEGVEPPARGYLFRRTLTLQLGLRGPGTRKGTCLYPAPALAPPLSLAGESESAAAPLSCGLALELSANQLAVCARFGATPDPPSSDSRLGIARNARQSDLWPLNGLRHRPDQGTSGWYLWRGAHLSQADDFFESLHTRHLWDRCPDAIRFLALPPGWRFLVAPGQEDVWYDATLLNG
jgi:hypothetical protein